jgi:biuret amidohydrolase
VTAAGPASRSESATALMPNVRNQGRRGTSAPTANIPRDEKYPTDHGWKFEGTLEKLMHEIGMFDRKGSLDPRGFEGSGADWLERYKSYIEDGQTVVVSPHKVYGPETNDLVLQLRKRGIDKVVLAGMSAVEFHMRELLEQGFELAVVKDATAGAKVPRVTLMPQH